MPTIEQLVQNIDVRMRELSLEIASLEDARAALVHNGGVPTSAPAPRAKPRRRAPSRASRRRSTPKRQVLLADRAERLLGESDGLTTAALAEQADAERDQVLALLRDLEAAGRVRRSGQRRGTRWHAFTDDDRIRERAAELEARRR
jgi:hypothetical protein